MFEVRERLNAYARKHERSDARSERMIRVAVEQLSLTLDFLEFAIDDYEAANANYRAEQERFMDDVRFNASGGEPKRTHSAENVKDRRRGYFLLHYRIDTFYVFARILLDDVAALMNRALAFAPVEIGNKHKGIAKHLPTIAAAKGLTGYEDVIARGNELVIGRGQRAPSPGTWARKELESTTGSRTRGRAKRCRLCSRPISWNCATNSIATSTQCWISSSP
jgi:hypothetical protein